MPGRGFGVRTAANIATRISGEIMRTTGVEMRVDIVDRVMEGTTAGCSVLRFCDVLRLGAREDDAEMEAEAARVAEKGADIVRAMQASLGRDGRVFVSEPDLDLRSRADGEGQLGCYVQWVLSE